jgi:hypothetical protein
MRQTVSKVLVCLTLFSTHSYAEWPEVKGMFSGKKSATSCPRWDSGGPTFQMPRMKAKTFTKKTPPTDSKPDCETKEYEKYLDLHDEYKDLLKKRSKISKQDVNDYELKVKKKTHYNITGPLGSLILPKVKKTSTGVNEEKKAEKQSELDEIDSKIADKKEEYKDQLNYWKMLCVKKNTPSSCELVKTNFKNTPTEENFENLIKTVAAVQLKGEDNKTQLIYLSTDDTKDKKKWGEIKDHMDKDRIEALEPKIKKAEKAMEIYEKQKKGEALEKRFESVCGGCSDIENMLKDSATPAGFKPELVKLAAQFKCRVKTIESCDKDKEFNKSATSIEALLKNPDDKDANFQLEKAYTQLKSVNDQKTGEPCMSCDQFLGMRETLPEESSKNLDPFLKKIGCPLPPKADPTCQEAIDTMATLSNDPDFDPEVIDPKYSEILQDVSEQDCCKELPAMQAVRDEVRAAKQYASLKVIDKSANYKITKALDCIICEEIATDDQKPKKTSTAQVPNTCAFYHKNNGKVNSFVCANGPPVNEKCTPGNAKFTQDAYGVGGKFGELIDFKLKCYCDPSNGESVNASCCPISNQQKVDKYGKPLTTKVQDGGDELYTRAKVDIFQSGQTEAVTIDSIEALCGWGISQLKTNYNEYMKNRTAICYEVNDKHDKGEVLGSVFEQEVEVFEETPKKSGGNGKGNGKGY